MARVKVARCKECGAELKAGPAPCPLCGTGPDDAERPAAPSVVVEVEDYQAGVRELRERLRKLRGA